MPRNNFTQLIKIYNLDETDYSNDCTPPKVVCTKGTKQVESVTSVSLLLLL